MKGNNPQVSVVIIAYNERHNIGRALRSVQRQTFADLEIVVVDDCSTDGTAEVVSRIAESDSRVVLHRLPHNHGMQEARIIGTRVASCDCVAFLDADDTFEPGAIEAMFRRMEETGADVVEMASRHAVNRLPLHLDLHIPSMYLDKEVYDGNLVDLLLAGRVSGNVWSKLYRREVIDQSRMQPTGHVIGEDVIFNLRVFSHASRLAWTDYRGVNYRSADANLTRLRRWDELKKLTGYLLSMPEVNADKNRLVSVSSGLADDLLENVALKLMNPFARKGSLRKWIKRELSDKLWDDISKSLCSIHTHRWLARRDADEVLAAGRIKLHANFKNYVLFYLLDLFG